MLILLSPAKTLDMTPVDTAATQPRLLDHTEELATQLRGQSPKDLGKLMKLSDKLSDLNYERFQNYQQPFDGTNATPAGYAFRGDVYQDLGYSSLTDRERAFADQQLRILSGFYGLLRPSDLMQAYRLEMGTRLKNPRGKNLYEFWGNRITELLNEDLAESKDDTVLNLASQEYFKSVNVDQLNAKVVNVHFKEQRGDTLRVIAFNAKKARGRMARLITLEGLTTTKSLPDLVVNDYSYRADLSTPKDLVYVKE